jgi:hypothetical protein
MFSLIGFRTFNKDIAPYANNQSASENSFILSGNTWNQIDTPLRRTRSNKRDTVLAASSITGLYISCL